MKEVNNISLAKQAKKEKKIVSIMPAIEKAFDLMCDDRIKLIRQNDAALKNKIGVYDEYWLKESKANLLIQIDDGKKQI